ncbi:SORTING NEXIN GRD19 HOMOLOG [Encephalitozoon cuniculi GB-M1]|uniref:Sorting nexin-3 n=1 Tax=Encephalitozoon cuniculi (strain GB-M1) TaxID=284813 RepID=Q8SRX2_ENCCU|nr:Snx3p-like protein [Encephalitozoon cuniculi GB-M1]KMV66140.1 PX domain-containing protein [Encephalitozoon cuniculi EcunIII-L]UYI27877.1 putative sorting nexin protein [Encephalitozoon cuniculi]CAD26603.1 SORTING NEXIN GRD19 HOMOLOG [Encephalitozoon cuniculi GB-M1]
MEEKSVLEITIPGSRNVQNKYTEYEVVCVTNSRSFRKCYTKVFRRYSDFHRLHCRLKYLMKVLPEFPRKRWNKMSREVVEERVRMLTVYMRFVCDQLLRSREGVEKIEADIVAFIQGRSSVPET